ncbi:transmembrane protein 62 isoform X2 [Anabrus simplex]|uniref:transmembrane protein 62 isoform X2 n=1 Tax=Anabrus simplex TaxID=316456 RepID=UPI0034DCE7B1
MCTADSDVKSRKDMPLSKTAFIAVIFILMFSVFVANITNIISVNVDTTSEEQQIFLSRALKDRNGASDTDEFIIGNSSEHLMWFLQISDIHVSIFHDLSRITELKEFCDLTINAIKPSVVLASGDLTDAKSEDNMGSRQYLEEWKYYKDILDECNIAEKTVWLDIRGNHDNFNVVNMRSKENYYRNYSVQGRMYPKSYLYQMKQDGLTYSFIALDACLEPGPRRPFNFVGVLTRRESEHITKLVEESRQKGGNFIIWFGHYPTSCILAPGPGGVRTLIGSAPEGLAYLCGHFHMLGGVVPNMYTLQQAGFLELELGDWKDNRMYRLAAVDHGLFSFIDMAHRDWPVGLITNPKHALYAMPTREMLEKIPQSTHVRVLAFSLSPIKSVRVRINDEDWQDCTHVEGPLYVAPWVPSKYDIGLHDIEVNIKDTLGLEKTITQPFSLDGTRLSFRLLPRIALMCNVSMVFQFFFGMSLVMCIVPLCIFKFLHKLVKAHKVRKPRIGFKCFKWWIRKLWVLSTVDRIFYPLVLYPLYLTVGPWSIGEVIEGYTGIIFAWGIIINGAYLPGSFTYAYGFLQMIAFQFPLTLCLAHYLDYRLRNQPAVRSSPRYICLHLPFLAVVVLQMMFAYSFWLAYGTMAFILGPLRTWSVVLAIILWYQACTLPDKCLREAALVWNYRQSHSPPITPREDITELPTMS